MNFARRKCKETKALTKKERNKRAYVVGCWIETHSWHYSKPGSLLFVEINTKTHSLLFGQQVHKWSCRGHGRISSLNYRRKERGTFKNQRVRENKGWTMKDIAVHVHYSLNYCRSNGEMEHIDLGSKFASIFFKVPTFKIQPIEPVRPSRYRHQSLFTFKLWGPSNVQHTTAKSISDAKLSYLTGQTNRVYSEAVRLLLSTRPWHKTLASKVKKRVAVRRKKRQKSKRLQRKLTLCFFLVAISNVFSPYEASIRRNTVCFRGK